jgi:4-diphosphocytidyl-2-C-methyl-D-erythritol kinase
LTAAREIAAAKLNLALHVRGRREDGRHDIETLFAFCTDGDRLEAESFEADRTGMSLEISGPFAAEIDGGEHNLVEKAWAALTAATGVNRQTYIRLDKRLPVAAGLGGGSADAAATLRLLTSLWGVEPHHAADVAPSLGSDVPACLLSLPARGEGAGDQLTNLLLPELSGKPVLLVNPRVQLKTADVFAAWDGVDNGPLGDDWRLSRNDLEVPATRLVPQIETVLAWLSAQNAELVRMSGSGATCFALFETEQQCKRCAQAVPREWWHLETSLR